MDAEKLKHFQNLLLAELRQKLLGFDKPRFALTGAVDLAVDAIEVAHLVGIEIHPHRDPARAAAEHRVDKPVLLELAGMIGM